MNESQKRMSQLKITLTEEILKYFSEKNSIVFDNPVYNDEDLEAIGPFFINEATIYKASCEKAREYARKHLNIDLTVPEETATPAATIQ